MFQGLKPHHRRLLEKLVNIYFEKDGRIPVRVLSLFKFAEDLIGVKLLAEPHNFPNEGMGLLAYKGRNKLFVYYGLNDSRRERRFTLAHELAHAFSWTSEYTEKFDKCCVNNGYNAEPYILPFLYGKAEKINEEICDQVAMYLLCPLVEVKKVIAMEAWRLSQLDMFDLKGGFVVCKLLSDRFDVSTGFIKKYLEDNEISF